MTDEIKITRRQLVQAGADDVWIEKHMKGRGWMPFSKVIACAPEYFEVEEFDGGFTGKVVFEDGEQCWYHDGLIHREGGPAAIYPDGTKSWYRNGVLHRDGAPAIVRSDGSASWYENNKLHREDGYAIEFSDGSGLWFLEGEEYETEADFKRALERRKKPK